MLTFGTGSDIPACPELCHVYFMNVSFEKLVKSSCRDNDCYRTQQKGGELEDMSLWVE